MYIDEVIRIGFAADGGFLISYDKDIAQDEKGDKKDDKKSGLVYPDEKWATRFVADAKGVGSAIESILDKAKKPKAPKDAFDDAFKEAVKSKD